MFAVNYQFVCLLFSGVSRNKRHVETAQRPQLLSNVHTVIDVAAAEAESQESRALLDTTDCSVSSRNTDVISLSPLDCVSRVPPSVACHTSVVAPPTVSCVPSSVYYSRPLKQVNAHDVFVLEVAIFSANRK